MTDPVVVSSDDLVRLFEAASATIYTGKDDPIMRCVYLASSRVDHPEHGQTDVLVAVSGDMVVAGQTTITCANQLPHPVLVDIKANGWIKSMIKNAKTNTRKVEGTNVDCDVELSVVPDASETGSLLVQTITDGYPGPTDTRGILPLADRSDYPIRSVMSDLIGHVHTSIHTEDRTPLPDGPVLGFIAEQTKVMKEIGTVYGEPVLQYPLGHSAARRVLTCSDAWRGTVPGFVFDPEVADEPGIELIELSEDDGDTETTAHDAHADED